MSKYTNIIGIAIFFILVLFSFGFSEETFTITTYYPSPYGSYRELTSYRMKIGTTYSDSGTSVSDNNLIVEGNVGIKTPSPGYALEVIGQIRMSGASGTKQVVGDVAEAIPVADNVEDGDVVSIDNISKKYQFIKSVVPHDTLVAGVISSTQKNSKSIPAMLIGDDKQWQANNPRQPYKYLTIAGQVAVKVCSEGGPIKKGNLLTTSSKPGYAMRAQKMKQGTIIGKALEDFEGKDGDKGIIIMLFALM